MAQQIWQQNPGRWEIEVIPENTSALKFWKRAVASFVGQNFEIQTQTVAFDLEQLKRIVLSFDTADALCEGSTKSSKK